MNLKGYLPADLYPLMQVDDCCVSLGAHLC
jgi:hypothetical protein